MTDELPEEPLAGPELEEDDDSVDFGDPEEMKFQGVRAERWDRAKFTIDVRDVLYMLYNRRGSPISCPFHGRDSKPSFYIYLQNNDCHCFGCPDGDTYWDNIKIVSRSLDITRTQALSWLEREFGLPPMESGEGPEAVDLEIGDEVEEEDDGDQELGLEDLKPTYLRYARRLVIERRTEPDVFQMARELAERYFVAEHTNEPILLAKVIDRLFGRDIIHSLVSAMFLATSRVPHVKPNPAT